MSKKITNKTTITEQSDGPTSVIMLGCREKPKDFKGYIRYLKNNYQNKKYKMNRIKNEKKVIAAPHSLNEVIIYITEKYHAIEINVESDITLKENSSFDNRKNECKAALIYEYAPELIGRSWEITPPNPKDETSIRNCLEEADEIHNLAISVPDEQFPLDYHLYHFVIPNKGEYFLEIEFIHAYISSSYSSYSAGTSKLKYMNKVNKDIFLFCGVSQQDIDEQSRRYKHLITILSS